MDSCVIKPAPLLALQPGCLHKSHWIEAHNLSGIPKVLLSLHAEDNDKETDWLWVCLDDHSLDWEHVKTLISTV
jgi:hypothetical protein